MEGLQLDVTDKQVTGVYIMSAHLQ